MSRYTLTWHPDAIDDLIRLAHELDVRAIKEVQDNVPLLLGDPRPVAARQLEGLSDDAWVLSIGTVVVEYEIIADSVIRILGVRAPN